MAEVCGLRDKKTQYLHVPRFGMPRIRVCTSSYQCIQLHTFRHQSRGRRHMVEGVGRAMFQKYGG